MKICIQENNFYGKTTCILNRKMQIKSTLRFHLTTLRIAKIKNTIDAHVGKDV